MEVIKLNLLCILIHLIVGYKSESKNLKAFTMFGIGFSTCIILNTILEIYEKS